MARTKYPDELLEEKFSALSEQVENNKTYFGERLDKILEQTTTTNGKVADAHDKINRMDTRIKMAAVAITVLIIVKFPELFAILKAAAIL